VGVLVGCRLTNGFAIVPSAEVDPLTQQLDGRLSAIHLQRRHVEVVDEEDEKLAQRRPKHSLAPAICTAAATTEMSMRHRQ